MRQVHLESFGEDDQFYIGDTAQLRFDFRQRGPAWLQAANAATGGKPLLRQVLLVMQLPDLRPHHVLAFGHAPKMEPGTIRYGELNCSNTGATCGQRRKIGSSVLIICRHQVLAGTGLRKSI